MKLILAPTVAIFVIILAVTNANPISTIPISLSDSSESMEIDPTMAMPEIIRNKRDIMIYDWGCEGEACDRDCKGRDFKSGHCTPFALINERCWCVPK